MFARAGVRLGHQPEEQRQAERSGASIELASSHVIDRNEAAASSSARTKTGRASDESMLLATNESLVASATSLLVGVGPAAALHGALMRESLHRVRPAATLAVSGERG